MFDWDAVFHDCLLSREQKRQICLPIFSARDLFQLAKVQPRCLKSDLGTCLRRFELHALTFDQRKLIYFWCLQGDLGMCLQNIRAVFLHKGLARLGWGGVFFLPKPARPTGLRGCLLFSLWGERGEDIQYVFLHLYFLLVVKITVYRIIVWLYDFWWNICGLMLLHSHSCLWIFV